MKVFLFAPINNEKLCLDVQLEEGKDWIDEFHVTEFSRTFQGIPKDFLFQDRNDDKLFVHSIDADGLFKYSKFQKLFGVYPKGRKVFSPHIHNKLRRVIMPWYNDAIQRNKTSDYKGQISDSDIVILSDIDEIIDASFAEEIIFEVKKRGVITIKLHFTLFYFNLFSENWGGPGQYSYRTFVMTGKYFKSLGCSSDYLRKLGENNKLINKIYCPEKVMGFHHSWLGDANFISKKLAAYAHLEHSHLNNMDYIRDCLKNNKSIFPDHKLVKNDSIKLLDPIENLRIKLPEYFI